MTTERQRQRRQEQHYATLDWPLTETELESVPDEPEGMRALVASLPAWPDYKKRDHESFSGKCRGGKIVAAEPAQLAMAIQHRRQITVARSVAGVARTERGDGPRKTESGIRQFVFSNDSYTEVR